MPLFHFNLADHEKQPDVEGTELPSEDAARIEAIIFAGSYLRDRPELIGRGRPFRVDVTDDDATALFSVKIELIEANGGLLL